MPHASLIELDFWRLLQTGRLTEQGIVLGRSQPADVRKVLGPAEEDTHIYEPNPPWYMRYGPLGFSFNRSNVLMVVACGFPDQDEIHPLVLEWISGQTKHGDAAATPDFCAPPSLGVIRVDGKSVSQFATLPRFLWSLPPGTSPSYSGNEEENFLCVQIVRGPYKLVFHFRVFKQQYGRDCIPNHYLQTVHRRQSCSERKNADTNAVGEYERVANDIKCVRLALVSKAGAMNSRLCICPLENGP